MQTNLEKVLFICVHNSARNQMADYRARVDLVLGRDFVPEEPL